MRGWIKAVALLLAIMLMLFVGWRMVRGMATLLSGVQGGSTEPDPMFAETPEPLPTRPPELDEEVPQPSHPTLDDYVPEVETPVDLTADELIRRAEEAERAHHEEPEAHGDHHGSE